MLKAIIADDEEWICKMIGEMIEWEELGIKLVGQAKDGLEAYQLICSQKPDIVITDIRMPGIDGLELIRKAREKNLLTRFIIISGFQQFEYAKKAIKFGVDDYLLKPIRKDELTNILEKIQREYNELEASRRVDAQMKKDYKESLVKLKEQFLEDLTREDQDSEYQIDTINSEFHTNFCEGYFIVLHVKLDRRRQGIHEMEDQYKKGCYSNYFDILNEHMRDYCCEIQRFDENLFLLNFLNEDDREIRIKIKDSLDHFLSYLHPLNYFDATIGVGKKVTKLCKLSDSVASAKLGIMCRITAGLNKIIDISEFDFKEYGDDNILSVKEEIYLKNIFETLDTESFQLFVKRKFEDISNHEDINPCIYFKIADQIGNIFEDTMSKKVIAGIHYYDMRDGVGDFRDCRSIEDISSQLTINLTGIMEKYAMIIDEYELAPIRVAKKFVSENYQEKILLDDVAQLVNMSPGYFCSYYRNKTGMNFHEYVMDYRLNIAKELLVDINKNVNEIAREVGYKDAKYFSKLFKKKIGVNPSDYRKIHL